MLADRYYYHRLKDKNQMLYKLILKAAENYQTSIMIGQVYYEPEDINAVNKAIILDNPYLFHFSGRLEVVSDTKAYTIKISYDFRLEEYEELKKDALIHAEKLLHRADVKSKTTEEIVQTIHDMIVKYVDYDEECLDGGDKKSEGSRYSYSILGVLIRKKAVCEGIAKAFKYLMNAVNIGCIVVVGKGYGVSSVGSEVEHAWNIVKIGNQNYHIDVTWDLNAGKDEFGTYDYYNLTDDLIKRDHLCFDVLPKCNCLEENYFYKHSAVMLNEEQLMRYIDLHVQTLPAKIYVRLAYECDFWITVEKVQERVMDRLYIIGAMGMIKYATRDTQKIIYISVEE